MRLLMALLVAFLAISVPHANASEWKPYEKTEFAKLLASGKPIVVHTHATW